MAKKTVKDKKSAKVTAPSKKSPAKKATPVSAKKTAPAKKSAPSKKAAPTKKTAPTSKPIAKKSATAKVAVPKAGSKTVAPAAKKGSTAKPLANKKVETPSKKVVSKKSVEPKKKTPAPVVKAAAKKAATAPTASLKEKIVPAPKTVPSAQTPTPVPPKAKPAGKPGRRRKKDDDDDDDDVVVVAPPPKVQREKSTLPKRNPGRSAGDELTLEGPAPKKISPIDISSAERIKLKKELLNRCLEIQKNNVNMAKKAMEDAMKSANEEKVTEELSDSFRENMHATRDMYARQVQEGLNNIGLLNRIMIQEHDRVRFGSVVFTNFQNYFISTGLGEIKVDDKGFLTVSTLSPLFQILADKKKGDTFMFLDRLYTVIEVF
jgi:hypothetical protein